MSIQKAKFYKGQYTNTCRLFTEVSVGSIRCVGNERLNIKPCIHFSGFISENSYYLPILKETIKIVSKVDCRAPGLITQFKLNL